jgi:hypothetical protein
MNGDEFIETIYRVYGEDSMRHGACIEVGVDGDRLGCVEIRTVGQKSEEYFGALRLPLPVAVARRLAKAIENAADDAETKL